jgi:hypothetical protein
VCQSCSPGTFSTAIGAANASTCQGCQAGAYLIMGAYACQLCSPGTFSTAIGGVNASTCQVCQAGTFSTQEGGVSCSLCLAGSFSPQSATTCESCLAGAYTTGSGSGNCSLCDAGTYSLGGAEECTPCGVGLFNNERGGWNCTSCLDGSFAGEGKSEVFFEWVKALFEQLDNRLCAGSARFASRGHTGGDGWSRTRAVWDAGRGDTRPCWADRATACARSALPASSPTRRGRAR